MYAHLKMQSKAGGALFSVLHASLCMYVSCARPITVACIWWCSEPRCMLHEMHSMCLLHSTSMYIKYCSRYVSDMQDASLYGVFTHVLASVCEVAFQESLHIPCAATNAYCHFLVAIPAFLCRAWLPPYCLVFLESACAVLVETYTRDRISTGGHLIFELCSQQTQLCFCCIAKRWR